MDTDWCLTCERHLEASSPAPYCSKPCRPTAGPSRFHPYSYYDTYSDSEESYAYDEAAVFYHHIADVPTLSYTANGDYSRIISWAHNVVPGPPPACSPQPTPSSSRASSKSRASSIRSSPTASPSTLHPPTLLTPSTRRPLAPTLSFTPTKPSQSKSHPARPLNTSPTSAPTPYCAAHSSSRTTSTAQDSSALATPASGVGVGAGFLDHVLSWVAPSPMPSAPHSPVENKSAFAQDEKSLQHLYSRGRRSGRAVA